MEASKRIKQLIQLIDHHSYQYFHLSAPQISDEHFDKLFEELIDLENQHPEFAYPWSPTQRIEPKGPSTFEKVEHINRSYSLDKVYTFEDLQRWIDNLNAKFSNDAYFNVEEKIDGVSVSLVYKDGVLIRGVTRGDGLFGEDITENVKMIQTIPLHVKYQGIVEIKGEVFVSLLNFHTNPVFKEFKNPRNAAAGSLRLSDPLEVKRRELQFIAFQEDFTVNSINPASRSFLRDNMFAVPEMLMTKSAKAIKDYIYELEETRDARRYEIDGVVIKINQKVFHEQLGYTARAPKWAIAYKFTSKTAKTTLERIEVQVGKSGVITPVAHLKPVEIAGATIGKATLHNLDFIKQKDIRIGDTVIVKRAGDVIPEIVAVDLEHRPAKTEPWIMPKGCPSCSAELQVVNSFYKCMNGFSCEHTLKAFLRFFVSPRVFDIRGMSKATTDQLVDLGIIKNPGQIFLLRKEHLLKVKHIKHIVAERLVKEIQVSKDKSFVNVLLSLGIPTIGITRASKLAHACKSMNNLMMATYYQLTAIEQIGNNAAEEIGAWFMDEDNLIMVGLMRNAGIRMELENQESLLSGKLFVITGRVDGYTRKELFAKIEGLGGRVINHVSSSVNAIIVGDKPGSKLKRAINLEIETIFDFDDYLETL